MYNYVSYTKDVEFGFPINMFITNDSDAFFYSSHFVVCWIIHLFCCIASFEKRSMRVFGYYEKSEKNY